MKRRSFLKYGISAGLAAACVSSERLTATAANERISWMQGRWGMMVHWIAPGPAPLSRPPIGDLNRAVDAFALDNFVEQFEESGASWIIFTIGQNTSYYASPNAYLDELVGRGHCSQRDLVQELVTRVKSIGRRSILYLPGEINAPSVLHKAFDWNPSNQSNFEVRYTKFIREYSVRFGSDCDGWWIDGCYDWTPFRLKQRHWDLWANALRAGNSLSALAFNDGSFTQSRFNALTEEQDFIAGECNGIKDGAIILGDAKSGARYLPSRQYIGSPPRQFHLLTPIDCGGEWGHPKAGPFLPPLYDDAELFPLIERCLLVGGAVTLNVGVSQEGFMSKKTIDQLTRLRRQ